MTTNTETGTLVDGEAHAFMVGVQRSITAAIAGLDLDALMDHFADDVRAYPNGAPAPLIGKEAVHGFYAELFSQFDTAGATAALEFDPNAHWEVIGELILDNGTSRLVTSYPGGTASQTVTDHVVWRRAGDRWQIIRYMERAAE